MATSVTETLLTAHEFYRLPDPIDGGRIELVEGRVVAYPPGGAKRGSVVGHLASALGRLADGPSWLVTLGSGYLIEKDPDTVLSPSVAVVRRSRLPDGDVDDGFVAVVPHLAVEVIPSPSGPEAEEDRLGRYLDAGVPRVWVVYERTRSVVVYSGNQEQAILTEEDTLGPHELGIEDADFSLSVSDIFR